jgi:uncharacterized metal-binding protein
LWETDKKTIDSSSRIGLFTSLVVTHFGITHKYTKNLKREKIKNEKMKYKKN